MNVSAETKKQSTPADSVRNRWWVMAVRCLLLHRLPQMMGGLFPHEIIQFIREITAGHFPTAEDEEETAAPPRQLTPAILNGQAIGPSLKTSKGNFTTNPSSCNHGYMNLVERGNKFSKWWTCSLCGSRWARTSPSDAQRQELPKVQISYNLVPSTSAPSASAPTTSPGIPPDALQPPQPPPGRPQPPQRAQPPQLWCHIFLNNRELLPLVIGKDGCHLRKIVQTMRAKIRVRGRGSGFLESNSKEAPVPLMVAIRSEDPDQFKMATRMVIAQLVEAQQNLSGSETREKLWRFGEISKDAETVLCDFLSS